MLTITRTWTAGRNKSWARMVDCLCECGRMRLDSRFKPIRDGKNQNCGCIKPEPLKDAKTVIFNEFFRDYRKSAKRRGIVFQLTKEQCKALFEGNCHLCGIEPQPRKPRKKFSETLAFNGIDRIDSTKGYFIGNVASCCTACNFLKSNSPHYEFLSHIKRIADYQYLKYGKKPCNCWKKNNTPKPAENDSVSNGLK